MKPFIITTFGCLILASCNIPSQSIVTESDTGRIYAASHLDSLRGMASGKRDAEAMRFSDALIAEGGTVKVLRWDNGRKYTAMKLVKCDDGTEFWQGPTPASGFYGSKLTTTILP